jgi:hypothetical protein
MKNFTGRRATVQELRIINRYHRQYRVGQIDPIHNPDPQAVRDICEAAAMLQRGYDARIREGLTMLGGSVRLRPR